MDAEMEDGRTVKKFMFVNRKAPYGTVYALEGLEVVLITAAFDQDVALAFIDDGVYQLVKGQNTKGIEIKNFSPTYRALEDYDIEKLYVERESLEARGLDRGRPPRRREGASGRRAGGADGRAGRGDQLLKEARHDAPHRQQVAADRASLDELPRASPRPAPLLLIEDGVYAATSGTAAAAQVSAALTRASLRARARPGGARPSPTRVLDGVDAVDYGGFVDLVAEHNACSPGSDDPIFASRTPQENRMPMIEVNGKTYRRPTRKAISSTSPSGTRRSRKHIATAENIDMTQNHWEVVNFLREYYNEYQIAPAVRVLTKAIGKKLGPEKGNSQYLYELFPYGPAKQACKIAGLPKPTGCV